MIQVTRLNNTPFVINSDLIKFVEQSPDTLITLLNGEKMIVRESTQDIVDRVMQFRRSVASGLNLTASDPNLVVATMARKHSLDEGEHNFRGTGRG